MARWEVGFIVGVTIFWTMKSHFEELISVCILVFIEASIHSSRKYQNQSIHPSCDESSYLSVHTIKTLFLPSYHLNLNLLFCLDAGCGQELYSTSGLQVLRRSKIVKMTQKLLFFDQYENQGFANPNSIDDKHKHIGPEEKTGGSPWGCQQVKDSRQSKSTAGMVY